MKNKHYLQSASVNTPESVNKISYPFPIAKHNLDVNCEPILALKIMK